MTYSERHLNYLKSILSLPLRQMIINARHNHFLSISNRLRPFAIIYFKNVRYSQILHCTVVSFQVFFCLKRDYWEWTKFFLSNTDMICGILRIYDLNIAPIGLKYSCLIRYVWIIWFILFLNQLYITYDNLLETIYNKNLLRTKPNKTIQLKD